MTSRLTTVAYQKQVKLDGRTEGELVKKFFTVSYCVGLLPLGLLLVFRVAEVASCQRSVFCISRSGQPMSSLHLGSVSYFAGSFRGERGAYAFG